MAFAKQNMILPADVDKNEDNLLDRPKIHG